MASDNRDQERQEARRQNKKYKRQRNVINFYTHEGTHKEKMNMFHARLRVVESHLKENLDSPEIRSYRASMELIATEPEFLADTIFWLLDDPESEQPKDTSPGADNSTLRKLLADYQVPLGEPASFASAVFQLAREISGHARFAGSRDDAWATIAVPPRRTEIPKSDGKTREIAIPWCVDTIVAKAIGQVIEPALDVHMPETVIGFRHNVSTEHGLAMAKWDVERRNRTFALKADIQQAYPNVPHSPLRKILKAQIGNPDMCRLLGRYYSKRRVHGLYTEVTHQDAKQPLDRNEVIAHIKQRPHDLINELAVTAFLYPRRAILHYSEDVLRRQRYYFALPPYNTWNVTQNVKVPRDARCRGILQGCSLSPILLNALLAKHVDQPWRQRLPDIPLIRYVDDFLCLCETEAQGQQCRAVLADLLAPLGMNLHPDKTQIVDLRRDPIHWLGHKIGVTENRFTVDLPDSFDERLEELIGQKGSWRSAQLAAIGKVAYHAPAINKALRDALIIRIDALIHAYKLNVDGMYDKEDMATEVKKTVHAQTRRWNSISGTISKRWDVAYLGKQ